MLSPLPIVQEDARDAARLANVGKLPSESLTASDEYTSIGYTKILEHIWMTGLERTVSVRRGGKLVCMPTQKYDVPSVWIGNIFVGIISVELDKIWNRQWNAKRAIILQTVILQRVSGAFGSRNIRV